MTAIILLLAVGFLLIFAEVFLPGGILGFIGFILLVAAVVLAYTDFGMSMAANVLMIEIIGGGIVLALGIKYFPQSPFGKWFILGANKAAQKKSSGEEEVSMVGKEGESLTVLRPSGTALIEGRRFDVISEGHMLEKNTKIRVIRQEGVKLIVRKANLETQKEKE